MRRSIRTIVVLHNRILRDGICTHLNTCGGVEVAATAGTADDLAELFLEFQPDLVLLDLDLPDGDAMKGIAVIRKLNPAAWIIGLAIYDEHDYCRSAIQAGVATVVPKDVIRQMLLPVIRAGCPARSDTYESPSVVELAELSLQAQHP